jgi:hypothetical protein
VNGIIMQRTWARNDQEPKSRTSFNETRRRWLGLGLWCLYLQSG